MRMRQDLMPFLLKMDLLFRTSYTKEFQNFSKQESFQDISIESSPLECHLHSALWKFDTFPDLMYPTIFERPERRREARVRIFTFLGIYCNLIVVMINTRRNIYWTRKKRDDTLCKHVGSLITDYAAL